MSVDQTSQLIQLLLNSVLMMALCGGAAIGLILRQTAIVSQIRLLKSLYADALHGVRLLAPERFLQLKSQLRLLRHHHRLIRIACWSANSALILCAGSTLLLALRTLVFFDRLIPFSLLLFTASTALLLLSLLLGLLSLVKANSLDEEREPEHRNESKPGRGGALPFQRDVADRSLPASLALSRIGDAQPPLRSQPSQQSFHSSPYQPQYQQKPPRA